MMLDERNEFADATALNTGAAGTYNVGDVIDLEVARDIGQGQPVWLVIQIATAPTSGGSATVQFQLVSDNTPTPATNGTQTIHSITNAYAIADLTQGWKIAIPLTSGDGDAANDDGYERYLGIQQVTGVAALTAGAINAFLTTEPSVWKAYPDAQN